MEARNWWGALGPSQRGRGLRAGARHGAAMGIDTDADNVVSWGVGGQARSPHTQEDRKGMKIATCNRCGKQHTSVRGHGERASWRICTNCGAVVLFLAETTDVVIVKARCQCSDPGCVHAVQPGQSLLRRSLTSETRKSIRCSEIATHRLFRVDMEDLTGTAFCDACGDDAWETGLFTFHPPSDSCLTPA